ncbi:unnamed protein product [Ixodes pacificus]
MSLNTAHSSDGQGGVILFTGEFILIFYDGVTVKFEGSDAQSFYGTWKGRIYLTTHRMLFVNGSRKGKLQSFSFPFGQISNLGLEQPIFGANYITGKVRSEPQGNWYGECNFSLSFGKGGAVEFGRALMEAKKLAARTAVDGNFGAAVLVGMPGMPYMVPPSTNVGFALPRQQFPNVPPAGTVFMANTVAPYPGLPMAQTAPVAPLGPGFQPAAMGSRSWNLNPPGGASSQPPFGSLFPGEGND